MVKFYGSETDQTVNGSKIAPDADDLGEQEDEGLEEQYDYSSLFDAPSYSDFIKPKPNSRAGTYNKRVQSMMKAGLIMSINNNQWPDAATFLKHGPGFATAAGNLAAEDPRAAQIIDMLTAPDSAYVMFAMVALPMIAQFFRNHEPEIKEAGQGWRQRRAERKQQKLTRGKVETPPVTVRLGKWKFTLPIRARFRLPRLRNMFGAFLAPTQRPDAIAHEVFSDESVIKALHKMGIYPRQAEDARLPNVRPVRR